MWYVPCGMPSHTTWSCGMAFWNPYHRLMELLFAYFCQPKWNSPKKRSQRNHGIKRKPNMIGIRESDHTCWGPSHTTFDLWSHVVWLDSSLCGLPSHTNHSFSLRLSDWYTIQWLMRWYSTINKMWSVTGRRKIYWVCVQEMYAGMW